MYNGPELEYPRDKMGRAEALQISFLPSNIVSFHKRILIHCKDIPGIL